MEVKIKWDWKDGRDENGKRKESWVERSILYVCFGKTASASLYA